MVERALPLHVFPTGREEPEPRHPVPSTMGATATAGSWASGQAGRAASCNRGWPVNNPPRLDGLLPELGKTLARLEQGLRNIGPICAYFELLLLASLFSGICDTLATIPGGEFPRKTALFGSLDRLLGTRQRLRSLLATDTARVGQTWPVYSIPGTPWKDLLAPFAPLAKPGGPLDWLEREGVQRLLASDAALAADFHYLRAGG